jgi:hypothetical protein
MIPKTLNMSMEEYLFLMDRDAGRSLTAFVSSDKRLAMWQIIADEEDRVAAYEKEFPCEFRLTVRPQIVWNPCIGHHLCYKGKVEGEAERIHSPDKQRRGQAQDAENAKKKFPFNFGGPIHKPYHFPFYTGS